MPESGHGIFTLHIISILLRREVRLKMLKETHRVKQVSVFISNTFLHCSKLS